MLNILLADTDQDNIKNIRTYLKGTFANLRVVEALTDHNRDIIDAVKELQPQLIIADIRYFEKYGYAAMRDIHERYPDMRFIVYGYYNDSEHMEHSRDFGVLEYLYRPLRRADLSRVLHAAISYFDKSDESRRVEQGLEEKYRERLPAYREILLRDLLLGHIDNDAEIYRSFDYFGIDFDKGFAVFIIRIDDFKKHILTRDETEKHMLSFKIDHITRNQLKEYHIETAITDFNTIAAILGGYEDIDKTISLLESLKGEIFQRINARVTIGLGRTYDLPTEIAVSYREADSALHYRFHLGEDSVIPIHYVEKYNALTYKYPMEKETRLVFAAVTGEYDYCRQLLEEIFDALKNAGHLPENMLPKLAMNILLSINRCVNERGIPMESGFTAFFSSSELLRMSGIDEAFNYLDRTLKNFCDYIVRYHERTDDELIDRAKSICEERYFETINLPKIAAELGVTPEYINRLFIKRENKPVIDYIMRLRLDKAKNLIRETTLSDDMIAVKLGFDDGRQLRSVFRQYEGINASDYRLQYATLSSQIKEGKRV
ncbi:MAG: helix-turn-helix domain-containing protein [Clostridiales bacterium]|jgi:two-component system response regulator YesN|nr:helix-turn-helix domain-containing protein [Clostridiales bacterium]